MEMDRPTKQTTAGGQRCDTQGTLDRQQNALWKIDFFSSLWPRRPFISQLHIKFGMILRRPRSVLRASGKSILSAISVECPVFRPVGDEKVWGKSAAQRQRFPSVYFYFFLFHSVKYTQIFDTCSCVGLCVCVCFRCWYHFNWSFHFISYSPLFKYNLSNNGSKCVCVRVPNRKVDWIYTHSKGRQHRFIYTCYNKLMQREPPVVVWSFFIDLMASRLSMCWTSVSCRARNR